MVSTYVFMNVNKGKALAAIKAVRQVNGVKQAHVVTGLHDIIAYVEAPDVNSLGKLVVSKLQSIDGVDRSISCIVVEG